jgi:trk system potassium uptake protein TrkH
MTPVHVTITARRVQSRALASPLIILYAFAGLITFGTLLLLLPFTHHGGGVTPFVDALFTATSAATVTGLITQDTATYWTRMGQLFILVLMFVGGLGFMTIATFLLAIIGQRVTLAQRLLMKESLGVDQLGGLVRLAVRIVLVAAGIQLVGFVALLVRFSLRPDYSPGEAIWQAAFHAVSGFNNAGFVALADTASLSAFQTDRALLAIIGVLILLGSISFWVMLDVVRFRRFSLFTLNTKLILVLSLVLTLSGALVFLLSEYDNTSTLGPLGVADKAFISVFESISGRTAGFSTVSFGDTEQHTNFFFSSLMFIGGASASVAGGVKVNTVAVALVAVLSTIRGRGHASAFGREIPQAQVQRAMTIGVIATAFVFLVAFMLAFSEAERGLAFNDLLFESVSAFGTVGLSTGLTADLSRWGHLILIATMFIGRIGPLTLALAMIQRGNGDLYRYAQERVTIG